MLQDNKIHINSLQPIKLIMVSLSANNKEKDPHNKKLLHLLQKYKGITKIQCENCSISLFIFEMKAI